MCYKKNNGLIFRKSWREYFLVGCHGEKPLKMENNSGQGEGEALNNPVKEKHKFLKQMKNWE